MDRNKKQKQQFTIIKDDSTDGHGGYGIGSISLENMSSIIVDPNENKAYVDMDAMHARSNIERRVRYYNDRSEVPDGKLYWRSEEHTSELQSRGHLVCRLLLEKKKQNRR